MRRRVWRWFLMQVPVAAVADRVIGRRNPFNPVMQPWRHGVYRRSKAVWLAYVTCSVSMFGAGAAVVVWLTMQPMEEGGAREWLWNFGLVGVWVGLIQFWSVVR